MIKTQTINYYDDGVTLQGYYAYDDHQTTKRPVILVAPDWSGRNQFACDKAELLAKLGYVGFAIDMYGEGKIGNSKEENASLMQPLLQNREKLQRRVMAAVETAKQLSVSNQAIGAIGFCFGGLCVLDLARSGIAVEGVVSFHGALLASGLPKRDIKAKILVLHGYNDPMVPPNQMLEFAKEMDEQQVDWQVHMYGNTMHGFTNPEANDKNFGTVYQPLASKRSWIAMQNFFSDIFNNANSE